MRCVGALMSALVCMSGCTSWGPAGRPEDAYIEISSDWAATKSDDALWRYIHEGGAVLTMRATAPPCTPKTCAVWAMAWLDAQWPGAQLISREEPVEGDAQPRWRIAVMRLEPDTRREVVLWHTPRRVYALDVQGSPAAMRQAAPDLDRIVASFTPAASDAIITRAAHTGPDTSVLGPRGVALAVDIIPAPSRAGLTLTPLDPARVQVTHQAMLIQGEVRSHTLPFATDAHSYLRGLEQRLAGRFDGKLELVVEGEQAGTLFIREPAMGSLVPMIHVWRVQLRGQSAVQVALSTPAELYDENKATLVALLRAFQPRR
jgi:hypothetical protein